MESAGQSLVLGTSREVHHRLLQGHSSSQCAPSILEEQHPMNGRWINAIAVGTNMTMH
ncbi:hypothetical protein MPNT_210044 [Candidatus Methylacidithermus pantelleriae]|uniref:Uncharacterized protein n=1 Tax=Candidatus Methylacidithermus pantelleriae TaxID=2744239 RepID=A0A8J2BLT0_9BACT|nr:hypothetical protein MPNT_210044 [Candidatus Methylacidithermus pantelleriae]